MLIIFEGVDGSGKTTLIKEVAKRLRSEYECAIENAEDLVPTRPGSNRIDKQTLLDRVSAMIKSNTFFLCDRLFLSDMIYRKYDKNKALIDMEDLIEVMLYNKNITIVYCHSEYSYERMIKRGDDNPSALEHHTEIENTYEQYLFELLSKSLCIDIRLISTDIPLELNAASLVNQLLRENNK